MKGTIKWYNPIKGYGFIQGENGNDVFVHRSAIPTGTFLKEEDRVEYEIEGASRGPKARDVRKL